MGRLLFALLLWASPPTESPVARLAGAFADEIARLATAGPVEIGPIEDRTGRGAAFALDVRSLLLGRLGHRVRLAQTGPRLRVGAVLSETPQRLVLSARVVSEPGGELVDLLTVSADTDPAQVPFSAAAVPALSRPLEVTGSFRSSLLQGPILDLLLLDRDRLVALTGDALVLHRWEGSTLALIDRQPLHPLDPVRTPGGLLVAAEGGLWVLVSGLPDAVYYVLEDHGRRLAERRRAASLAGLRYRPGTNLLEGTVGGLGEGPFVAARLEPSAAVASDGRLLLAAGRGPRVGSALAPLWPGVVAASSPAPPPEDDAILLIEDLTVLDAIPVSGPVRALTGSCSGPAARLVAAVEEASGTRLLVLDLLRPAP